MKVVAYYTDSGSYPDEARLLRASLDVVGMEHEIVRVKDRGDWYSNTAHKVEVLTAARDRLKGPIVYVDVDAFFHANCTQYFEDLAAVGVDFGAHWFQGPAKGHDQKKLRAEGWWMLTGTLFLGDTPGTRRLLDTWSAVNHALQKVGGVREGMGQKNLWYTVTCLTELSVQRLPGRYCYVFDKPWAYPSDEPRIIEHTIASRDHRRGTGKKNKARAERITELHGIAEAATLGGLDGLYGGVDVAGKTVLDLGTPDILAARYWLRAGASHVFACAANGDADAEYHAQLCANLMVMPPMTSTNGLAMIRSTKPRVIVAHGFGQRDMLDDLWGGLNQTERNRTRVERV